MFLDMSADGTVIMGNSIRLNFGNLPLVEATIRASFLNPIQLGFSTINKVHDRLKPDFPQLAELNQVIAAPGISEEITFNPGKIYGARFVGNKNGLEIVLQNRVVLVQWLKQTIDDAPEYPRFETLKKTLTDVIDVLKISCEYKTLPLVVINMSYVDFIETKDLKSTLKHYFSNQIQTPVLKDVDEIRKVESAWCQFNMDFRYNLEQVTAEFGENIKTGFKLTTVAGVYLSKIENDCERAIDTVHDRLQELFQNIISGRAKKEWELSVVDSS